MTRYILLLISVVLISGCANGLFYYPNSVEYMTPADSGLVYEDVVFDSLDGTRLQGWFIPSKEDALGTVVHYHGNAGNMTGHFRYVNWLPLHGYNLFVFDYRGYGKSEGHPDRKGVYQDSVAALDYVLSRDDVDRDSVFLIGQSLGGANAIAVAATYEEPFLKGVVVDSSFYSYRSIAREKIARIPVLSLFRWPLSFLVVTNSYPSGELIKKISPVPVLIIHGTDDQVVPYHHGEYLYDSAGEPKEILTVDGGKHTDALSLYGYIYRKEILRFFKKSQH